MKLRTAVFTVFFLMVFITGAKAFTVPDIDGYADFGANVSDIMGGGFSLDPIDIINGITDNIMMEIRAFAAEAAVILLWHYSRQLSERLTARSERDQLERRRSLLFSPL